MPPKIIHSHEKDPAAPRSKFSKRVFFEYSPGETSFQLGYLGADKSSVEGVLRLRYNDDKPIFAKKISLHLIGKEFVHFAGILEKGQDGAIKGDDESEFFDDDEEVSTSTVTAHTSKRQFFTNKMVIWRSQNKGHYESIKYLDLPFKINLPNNLPPSTTMDKGCGRIYYTLKAVVSRQRTSSNSFNKKVVKYVIPIIRHAIISQPTLIHWSRKEEGPVKAHVYGYDVSAKQTVFSPRESVVIPVKLFFYESQVYLKKIFVGIKEYHELRTNKYETLIKRYIVEETIQADAIPISSGPDDERFVELKFNVPAERQLTYDVDSTYLTVSHKLKIKVSLGRAPDLHLSNFIKIENLVNEDEVFPPPPPIVNVPQVIAAHEPVVIKSKRESYRRLTPFFPLFSELSKVDNPKKKFSSKPIQLCAVDSKSPNVVYNSRSLTVKLDKLNEFKNIDYTKMINKKNKSNTNHIGLNIPKRITAV